jgi:transposase
MSLTQNEKIRQVSDTTMVIGVDIASETHWARAFDWRGLELAKTVSFENNLEGFTYFLRWITETAAKTGKGNAIIGMEPTGHYWFTLAAYLQGSDAKLVLVNPSHVKKSKELDDGHPSKNDRKDPKTIAKLVLEGRYSVPYIPEGLYAELRVAMNGRWRILKELTSAQNRIQRWLKIYFPEHNKVFGDFTGAASMALLRAAPLPADLVGLGADGINQIWRGMKLRAVGMKRATKAFETAKVSVGCTDGITAARMELRMLLEDYDAKLRQYEEIMDMIEALCGQIPAVEELLKIKGIGLVTIAGIFAEIGDAGRFGSPRQLQKLAGLAITENSSGKHKGKAGISRRGRARLRAILFRAALPLVRANPGFRSLHHYYTTRAENPLKKMQSIIAVCCKLLRVFFAIATKGCAYSPEKMLSDIRRNQPLIAA